MRGGIPKGLSVSSSLDEDQRFGTAAFFSTLPWVANWENISPSPPGLRFVACADPLPLSLRRSSASLGADIAALVGGPYGPGEKWPVFGFNDFNKLRSVKATIGSHVIQVCARAYTRAPAHTREGGLLARVQVAPKLSARETLFSFLGFDAGRGSRHPRFSILR